MKKSISLLRQGFQSSTGKTPEFMAFVRTFKSEFKKVLESIGATNIIFSVGHFYISGFFTSASGQVYYFSLPDVRSFDVDGNGHFSRMMYRTAKDYKDYTGGSNQWVSIFPDMAENMRVS